MSVLDLQRMPAHKGGGGGEGSDLSVTGCNTHSEFSYLICV
jgi:hypothetical protein